MSDSLHPSTHPRRRPQFNHIGIDPNEIVGKTLQRARRSPVHPTVTLDFADNTTVQVLVDGYDPAHRGIPKQLEMDVGFDSILSKDEALNLEVLDCTLVTLQDSAFDCKNAKSPSNAVYWDQKHLAVAFKFAGETPRWHCIWARKEEYDEELGSCVFRSYDDIYLEKLQRTLKKPKWKNSIRRKVMAS